MGRNVLLTGATGFLGRELLKRFLDDDQERRVWVIVRSTPERSAKDRAELLLDEVVGRERARLVRPRLVVVEGDITVPGLSPKAEVRERLAAEIDHILHGAATVQFHLPLEEARKINLEGTRNVLDLARVIHRKGHLERLDYIGTAYVAGRQRGTIPEDRLDASQKFRNTYEQTKFEAEKLVREAMRGGQDPAANRLPVAIFRPSIIVGDSKTGVTSSFKVMYWPLKMYARGFFWVYPAYAETTMDIVPVDFVTDAIHWISCKPDSVGKVFHLTAGPGNCLSIDRISQMASEFFGVRRAWRVPPFLFFSLVQPILRLLPGRHKDIVTKGRVYLPYFSCNMTFDTSNTRRALEGSGIELPRVIDYLERLFRYCQESDWGKKTILAA